MKYVGQTSELTVRMDDDSFSPDSLDRLAEAYAAEHEKTYGYRVDEPMQLVSVRVVARGLSDADRVPGRIAVSRTARTDQGNGQTVALLRSEDRVGGHAGHRQAGPRRRPLRRAPRRRGVRLDRRRPSPLAGLPRLA